MFINFCQQNKKCYHSGDLFCWDPIVPQQLKVEVWSLIPHPLASNSPYTVYLNHPQPQCITISHSSHTRKNHSPSSFFHTKIQEQRKMVPFRRFYGFERWLDHHAAHSPMELNAARSKTERKSTEACKSHREAERRRRQRINSHLSTLRSLLPNAAKVIH